MTASAATPAGVRVDRVVSPAAAHYYNERDQHAAQWLRELIAAGELPAAVVDERDIRDVRADELAGFTQCHFFAGIGGWPLALKFAGWPDERPVWTGSCPCQPFSAVGTRRGADDERHLWPDWYRLIAECRPPTVFGEQVARGGGLEWLAGVRLDLEAAGYAVGAANIPACSVAAPQKRERLWFVAVGNAEGERRGEDVWNLRGACGRGTATGWIPGPSAGVLGADGTRRRMPPEGFSLGHGIPGRVEQMRGFGNAIHPAVGALFVSAFMSGSNVEGNAP